MPIGKIAQKNPNLLQALQYSRAQGSWEKDRESKRPEVVASNWLSDPLDAISCAGEMRDFNSYNPRVRNLDIRFSISFDDSDRLTREQEKEFTMMVMKEMGVKEDVTQYAVIRHNDTEHPHHHVEINRVGLDGAAIDGSWTKYRLELAIDKVEKQMGLSNHLAGSRRFTYAPGTEKGYIVQKANFPSRKGGVRKPPNTLPKVQPVSKKQELQDKILGEIRGKGTTDIEQLKSVLAGKGIGLEIRRNNADKVTGIKLFYENQHYKGMSIGLKASALVSELEKEAVRKVEAERQAEADRKEAEEQARKNRDAISERIQRVFREKNPTSWEAFGEALANDGLKIEVSGEKVLLTSLKTNRIYSLDELEAGSDSNDRLGFDYFDTKIASNNAAAEKAEAERLEAANKARQNRDIISERIQRVFREKNPTSWEAFGDVLANDGLKMEVSGKKISLTSLKTKSIYSLDELEIGSDSNDRLGFDYFDTKIASNKAAAEKAEAERLEAAKEARKNRDIISQRVQKIFTDEKPSSWEEFGKALEKDSLALEIFGHTVTFTSAATGNRYPLSSLEISSGSDEKLNFEYFNTMIANNKAEADRVEAARVKAEQDRKERDVISARIQRVFREENPISWAAFGEAIADEGFKMEITDKNILLIQLDTDKIYSLSSLDAYSGSNEKLTFDFFNTEIANNKTAAEEAEAMRIAAEAYRRTEAIKLSEAADSSPEANPKPKRSSLLDRLVKGAEIVEQKESARQAEIARQEQEKKRAAEELRAPKKEKSEEKQYPDHPEEEQERPRYQGFSR